MSNPIQHITCLTTAQRLTINADYPTGVANVWTGTVVTDPSTNTKPLGRPIRNMLNSGVPATPTPRVVRAGGSGRPQIRNFDPATPADCTCREYTGSEGEFSIDFVICSYETFPLDVTSRWGPSAGGTLTAPGPDVPTQSEINAIWQAVNASADEPIGATVDAHCSDLADPGVLVAYYRFQNDLTDSSATGFDLVDLGGTTFGAGFIDRGMTGGSGAGTGGILGGVWTVSAWLYDDGTVASDGARIIVLDNASVPLFTLRLHGTGSAVKLYVDGAVTHGPYSATTGWNMVTITYNAGVGGIYLNGELAVATPIGATANPSDGVQFVPTGAHTGKLDEGGVWNAALSALEVHVLYHGGAGFDPTM